MRHAAEQQLEAIEAHPGAILREVFDFEDYLKHKQKRQQ